MRWATSGPICFIASAFCNGPTLAAWLAARAKLVSPRWAAEWTAKIARAVHYAHAGRAAPRFETGKRAAAHNGAAGDSAMQDAEAEGCDPSVVGGRFWTGEAYRSRRGAHAHWQLAVHGAHGAGAGRRPSRGRGTGNRHLCGGDAVRDADRSPAISGANGFGDSSPNSRRGSAATAPLSKTACHATWRQSTLSALKSWCGDLPQRQNWGRPRGDLLPTGRSAHARRLWCAVAGCGSAGPGQNRDRGGYSGRRRGLADRLGLAFAAIACEHAQAVERRPRPRKNAEGE